MNKNQETQQTIDAFFAEKETAEKIPTQQMEFGLFRPTESDTTLETLRIVEKGGKITVYLMRYSKYATLRYRVASGEVVGKTLVNVKQSRAKDSRELDFIRAIIKQARQYLTTKEFGYDCFKQNVFAVALERIQDTEVKLVDTTNW